MLEVRTARADEIGAVVEFYTRMIDEMRGTDFDVRWRHGEHPSEGFLRASVEAGEVLEACWAQMIPTRPRRWARRVSRARSL